MRETELFAPVREWFERQGFEVYPEMEVDRGGSIADLVGVREDDGQTFIAELKTSLSIALIDQCFGWQGRASKVWAVVPEAKTNRGNRRPGSRQLSSDGTGLLEVSPAMWTGEPIVSVRLAPEYYDKPCDNWIERITEYHKTHAPEAGTANGGYISDYRVTILGVQEYLRLMGDWTSMCDILENCKTHYKNPQVSLHHALVAIEGDWCEVQHAKGNGFCYRIKEGWTV